MKLDAIPVQISLDKLPDEFTGSVTEVKEGKSTSGNPKLVVSVNAEKLGNVTLGYKIPKALTGKGQFDKLIEHLKALKMNDTNDLVGRAFRFKKENLSGTMQGNPRHYPIEEVKTTKK